MHDDVDGTPWQEAYRLPTVAHADNKNLNNMVERDQVLREAWELESTGDEEQP